MNRKVVIIGGGASGLMAAITAAHNGSKVTIIEHKDRVGKKILMTGNGKCNLTNLSDFHGKYYSDNLDTVYQILERFTPNDTCDFFNKLGLYTKEKRDGGVYPASEQASAVLDILRTSCDSLGIRVLTTCEIINIDYKNKKIIYLCEEKNSTISFDKIIFATGGKSASVSGSDGSGYKYARELGLKIIKPLPALVQLRCEGKYFKALAGVRSQAILSLYVDSKKEYTEEGELQLTDYGISGIPVFQFSRIAAKALDNNKKVSVKINFLAFLNNNQISNLHDDKTRFKDKKLEVYLNGLINKKLSGVMIKAANLNPDILLGQLSEDQFKNIINLLTSFEVNVKDTNPFENAQVTCGGIDLQELDSFLNCKKNRDIYFVGEILDCDGICGGYNLQWAWATGYIAGKHAATN